MFLINKLYKVISHECTISYKDLHEKKKYKSIFKGDIFLMLKAEIIVDNDFVDILYDLYQCKILYKNKIGYIERYANILESQIELIN